jgi:hypothetical protein
MDSHPLTSVKSKHLLEKRLAGARQTLSEEKRLNTDVQVLPLWVRAPVKGPEYWTGFSRSKLFELAKDGKIQSVSIREEGQRKGTRLFELKSILDFIDSRVAAQKAAQENGVTAPP